LVIFLDQNKDMSEEQQIKFERFINNRVERLISQRTYNWKPIDFNNQHLCHQYLLTRIAPEYSVIQRIFHEIQQRDPDFAPKSLFDFGSGIGTVTMYVYCYSFTYYIIQIVFSDVLFRRVFFIFRNARNFWGNSLKEYFCVDTSSTMNDLAKLLLQEGNPNNEKTLPKGLFYRQFLPAMPNVREMYKF